MKRHAVLLLGLPALALGCITDDRTDADDRTDTDDLSLAQFCADEPRLEVEGSSSPVLAHGIAAGTLEIASEDRRLIATIGTPGATLDHPLGTTLEFDLGDPFGGWNAVVELDADGERTELRSPDGPWALEGRVTLTSTEQGLVASDVCVAAHPGRSRLTALRFYVP